MRNRGENHSPGTHLSVWPHMNLKVANVLFGGSVLRPLNNRDLCLVGGCGKPWGCTIVHSCHTAPLKCYPTHRAVWKMLSCVA